MPACELCETRRPRRHCPGVRGEICAVCCGTEREVTVNCPLDCEYLQDARKHERLPELDASQIPNQDVRVTEGFLQEHEPLLGAAARALAEAALATPGAIDFDLREALESLIRTYRTLASGLVYESLPANPLAAGIHRHVQQTLEETRRRLRERYGMSMVRDAGVLGVLVFLQRLEMRHNNGRKRGRAFLDFLRGNFTQQPAAGGPPIIR